jgi:hypothetical protein
MRFDEHLSIPAATTDADPLTSPATVPQERIFRIRKREPSQGINSNRLIAALVAPVAESLSVVVWALDDLDDAEVFKPSATDRWVRVATFAGLQGGEARQTAPALSNDAFIGGGGIGAGGLRFRDGGMFYFQVTSNNLTATRELLVRSTV